MQYIVNVLKGIVLALANIIPGVSGGTMAVVMGIYDRILAPLSLDFKAIRRTGASSAPSRPVWPSAWWPLPSWSASYCKTIPCPPTSSSSASFWAACP